MDSLILATNAPDDDRPHVAQVRAFNRFYTNVIGVLRDGLLQTPYSLTEARVIFELAQRDATEVGHLRRKVDIDGGYLSRILGRFEADELVTREPSPSDGRRQVIRLTPQGMRTFATLDRRSADAIRALLSHLTDEEQQRLVAAMRSIEGILGEPSRSGTIVLRAPTSGDFGWVVHRHGLLYRQQYGWDETFEALVARIVADYVDRRDARRESAWIAELNGECVGCVFCTKREEKVAQLRLLLVEPSGRGMGVGSRLVEECVRFARRAGYERMMLWTNDVLVEARRIYERAGFELGESEEHNNFGHDLVGQNWWLTL